jgi:polyisoprenoid-binding protein YceI
MAESGQLTTSALRALLSDGGLAGSWTLDEARSEVHLYDVANHPDFTFTADCATPADGGVLVTGRLAIRDQARPVSFEARASVIDGEVWLDAEVPIDRTDYGMTWNMMGMAATKNTIVIHAVFTRQ